MYESGTVYATSKQDLSSVYGPSLGNSGVGIRLCSYVFPRSIKAGRSIFEVGFSNALFKILDLQTYTEVRKEQVLRQKETRKFRRRRGLVKKHRPF